MISPPVLKPISNTTSISASSPRTHSRTKVPYSNIEFAAEFTLQALYSRTHHTTISCQPTDANYRPSAAEPATPTPLLPRKSDLRQRNRCFILPIPILQQPPSQPISFHPRTLKSFRLTELIPASIRSSGTYSW